MSCYILCWLVHSMPRDLTERRDFLDLVLTSVNESIELKSQTDRLTWRAMRIQASRDGPASVVFPLESVIVNDLNVKNNLKVDQKVNANEVQTNFVNAMNIETVENISVKGEIKVERDIKVKGDVIFENGADCAEEFDVISNEIDPGTVMVLNRDGILEPSSSAYDKRVAGIVSGAGDLRPGIILDKHKEQSGVNNRIPIALMGKVNCKVDANYSSVEIGDLLTASPTLGHAMKAEDPYKAFGSVIGKALGSLKDGLGMIPVLVALQ